MESSITIAVYSIGLTASVIFGVILWRKRKDVPDRSRTFLSAPILMFSIMGLLFISMLSVGITPLVHAMLDPAISIIGLYAISSFLYYPIEIMRPRWLTGWKLLIPLTPAILVTIPLLFGIKFQDIQSFSDIKENLTDIDILLRVTSNIFLVIISLLILFIPYNWRKTSADRKIIHRYVILSLITTIIYLCNCLAGSQMIANLNVLWYVFFISQLTYYELEQRIIAPVETQDLPDEPEHIEYVADDNQTDDLWQRINHQMDKHEIWRNPDVTVEMMSRAVGTNRIYVADCIREHTGLTFNDYLNKWRTEYMADKLRQNPAQDQKPLYFEIGYRNRQTAYRNFIKFIGCSPSDFVASL